MNKDCHYKDNTKITANWYWNSPWVPGIIWHETNPVLESKMNISYYCAGKIKTCFHLIGAPLHSKAN